MRYIGVDPGAGGGIAVVGEDGKVVDTYIMPATERDVFDAIEGYSEGAHAVLEKVWSSPGWGHAGAFAFGVSVGQLRMALTAAMVPFTEVVPRVWQKAMGVVIPKNTAPVDRKNISKRRAQQLFPHVTVTHAIADALLLAEYCRRIHLGSQVDRREESTHGKEEGGKGRRSKAEREEESRRLTQTFAQNGGDVAQAAADEITRRAVAATSRHGAGAQSPARQSLRGNRRSSRRQE